MKKGWMKVFRICVLVIAATFGLRAQSPEERIQNLVVMIEGKLADADTQGAGIIFGAGSNRLYIVTANHVVRRGAAQASNLQVKLKWLPGESTPATLLEQSDSNLDIAVLAVTGLRRIFFANSKVPFDSLGDTSALKRRDNAYTLGYPSGHAWYMPAAADKVAATSTDSIQFDGNVFPGNSGGALLNANYELIGLVRNDAPPDSDAANIDRVIEKLKSWGYPVRLSRSVGGSPANLRIPNFAGAWDFFEYQIDGVPKPGVQPKDGTRLTVAQDGRMVRIGARKALEITAAGDVGIQEFMKAGQLVNTEGQADLIVAYTWKLEGDVLVEVKILHYRSSQGNIPAGATTSRTTKYRRVSADPPRKGAIVTISSASCSVVGPSLFRINMAGKVSVPVGETFLFHAEASGPAGSTRWRPNCRAWGPADQTQGKLWRVSCVHRPNDPAETSWQTTTELQLDQPPTVVYARTGVGGAAMPVTCVPSY